MRKAYLCVGLGYGDESKGSVVDWLCRKSDNPLVVRFNGGPQAAHNVVTPEGKHHTFAQFGAGTLAGAATYLSRHMLVNPLNLLAEDKGLQDIGITHAMNRLRISPWAKLITPWHKALNRASERASGSLRHGTCAQGIGEAMRWHERCPELTIEAQHRALYERASRVRDEFLDYLRTMMPDQYAIEAHVFEDQVLDDFVRASQAVLNGRLLSDEAALADDRDYIFEGAQGVLLDEWYGWHPFTTWSTTTFENAEDLLASAEAYDMNVTRLGLIRALPTRHGHGPFPTESVIPRSRNEHNQTNEWQGSWRVGWPDLLTLRYATEVCKGIDELVVTCMDQLLDEIRIAYEYETAGRVEEWFTYPHLTRPHVATRILPQRIDLPQSGLRTIELRNSAPRYLEVAGAGAADQLLDALSHAASAPVTVCSYGPTALDKVKTKNRTATWFLEDVYG